ncbi:hypothetical protein FS837_003483 [Tulasnella sp. UAMH 9824]|nr:hypothetical protein FS837_003483 [Tulasnella sp. UAMH 9824]
MQTSTNGVECMETTPDGGQPTQMDLDQDSNQYITQFPTSYSTLTQESIGEVAPNPKTKKLSVVERLGRLSKYRIRPTSTRSTAKRNGKGREADVVRATFKRKRGALRGKPVAVKKTRYGDSTDEEKFSKEFVHEVELLARLSHENIVQFVGFVEDLKHHKAWIYVKPTNHTFQIKDMFKGLRYLHTRQPPICHGDLRSLNILVSASCRAVITDFGSARVLRSDDDRPVNREKMRNANEVGVADEGDSCPEVTVVPSANQLTLTGPVGRSAGQHPNSSRKKHDRVWKVISGQRDGSTGRVQFENLKRDCAVMFKVIQGKAPMIQEDTEVAQLVSLCSLMTDCWKYKHEDRPHVDQCRNELQWMPSVPPLGGTSSGGKEPSLALLLKMGRIHFSQDRHEKAAALFERVLNSARSLVNEGVVTGAFYLGKVYYAQLRTPRRKNRIRKPKRSTPASATTEVERTL